MDITGNYARRIKSWVNSQIAAITLRLLPDVDDADIGDNKYLKYDAATSKHVYVTGGGVTDHGALTGLADDDHPQYTRDTEVDAIVATHTAIAAAHHVKYTDAEVDAIVATHTAIAAAHHVKYTDAEAVAAVLAGDDYIKNIGDTLTGNLTMQAADNVSPTIESTCKTTSSVYTSAIIAFYKDRSGGCLVNDYLGFFRFMGRNTGGNYAYGCYFMAEADGNATATYVPGRFIFAVMQADGTYWRPRYNSSKQFDMQNGALKDPKNHAASALSGTKKLVEIDIGGTSYYFEVHPTKA